MNSEQQETVTVAGLIEALQKMPQAAKVQVWLPGKYIDLCSAFVMTDYVLIKGNVGKCRAYDSGT